MPHDFSESLNCSHAASDLPIWREIYEAAFPGFVSMNDHRQNGSHQAAGVDRSIVLASSEQVLIDEKIRTKPYDDILLEYWSDERRRVYGWICKPLRAQYIAYAIAPLGKAYLLPVVPLQNAWTKEGAGWIKRYREVRAKNRDKSTGREWDTLSVPIPVDVLFRAVGAALRIRFTPVGEENGSRAEYQQDEWTAAYEQELARQKSLAL